MPYSASLIQFEVLKSLEGNIGLITLNRTQQFNALNQSMVQDLFRHLTEWREDPAIQAVIIQAAPGKAFCSGGDLKMVHEYLEDPLRIQTYFRQEYQLDLLIQQYPKPYIAFLNGITMGGGAGISILGSHRIATENTIFAMPETGIGFFSDAGTTYYLSKIQNAMGIYLALTGARLNPSECLALGLVDAYLPAEQLSNLIDQLCQRPLKPDPNGCIASIISSFSKSIDPDPPLLNDTVIAHAFSQPSVDNILSALNESHSEHHQRIGNELLQKSPMSLKANLKILQQATFSDFKTCLNREFRLASRLSILPDFKEGIRSAIIDKDKCPRWIPHSLSHISDETICDLLKPFENPNEELTPEHDSKTS